MQDMSALRAGLRPTSKELAIGSWFAEVALEKSDQDVRLFQIVAEGKRGELSTGLMS
jgi:hypothetical protein